MAVYRWKRFTVPERERSSRDESFKGWNITIFGYLTIYRFIHTKRATAMTMVIHIYIYIIQFCGVYIYRRFNVHKKSTEKSTQNGRSMKEWGGGMGESIYIL